MNMPTVGCVGESIIGNDERGLWFLSHKDDPSQMNWVEGEKCWGSVKVPMGLNVTRTLSVLENGELEECYTFENVSGEPLFIKEKDAYIYEYITRAGVVVSKLFGKDAGFFFCSFKIFINSDRACIVKPFKRRNSAHINFRDGNII